MFIGGRDPNDANHTHLQAMTFSITAKYQTEQPKITYDSSDESSDKSIGLAKDVGKANSAVQPSDFY